MLTLALVVMLAQTGDVPQRPPRTDRVPRGGGRSASQSPADVEFATSSGAGMGTACACTAVTGTIGQVLTVTRSGNGTCTKTASSGLATTGIADGDLVVCGTNTPRVEYGNNGYLGVLSEGVARVNTAIASATLCSASWADVGTPSCASDVAAGPWGTTTMDSITDNAAGAFEGRSQTIATTSATKHVVAVYVKSSTATSASITLVGTGSSAGDCTGTATGLSSTTSTRLWCVSPAAYAGTLTAVTVTVRVGTVVADTGVLLVESADHVVNVDHLVSHIPTVGTAVTRNAETVSLAYTAFANGGSMSSRLTTNTPLVANGGYMMIAPTINGTPALLGYFNSAFTCYTPTRAPTAINQSGFVSGSKSACWLDATTSGISIDGVVGSTSNSGTWASSGVLQLGATSTSPVSMDGIHNDICVSSNVTRCR